MHILSPSLPCLQQESGAGEGADTVGSGVEGSVCKSTPHPAYGSELSTGGGRLVRA
jgi:hypothetical protein